MVQPASAFLVARRDDGFGDVYPLHERRAVHARPRPTTRLLARRPRCASTPRCLSRARTRVVGVRRVYRAPVVQRVHVAETVVPAGDEERTRG